MAVWYNEDMITRVSHRRDEESIEAKALWFRSLSMNERMELFCAYTDIALDANPDLMGKKYVKPVKGRIQVLTAP